MEKIASKTEILNATVEIYFEENCTTEEAVEKAKKKFNISDEEIRKVFM